MPASRAQLIGTDAHVIGSIVMDSSQCLCQGGTHVIVVIGSLACAMGTRAVHRTLGTPEESAESFHRKGVPMSCCSPTSVSTGRPMLASMILIYKGVIGVVRSKHCRKKLVVVESVVRELDQKMVAASLEQDAHFAEECYHVNSFFCRCRRIGVSEVHVAVHVL
jgi:hypothetical protein